MEILKNEGLSFDDALLVPRRSDVLPNQVDVSTVLCGKLRLKVPFVSAGMDTVTESRLAAEIARLGGIGIIHKSMSAKLQAQQVAQVKAQKGAEDSAVDEKGQLLCGAAVGVTADMLERAGALIDAGVDVLTVDTAHGHSAGVINAVKNLRAAYPNIAIIAGNVATAAAVRDLAAAGADCVKVGIGPGSICTTRVVSGVGMPQLSAVMDCAAAGKECGVSIIADGGIKYSGDVVKALAAGADAVMLGSLFAAAEESPGETVERGGKKYKCYRGMGSTQAMKSGSGDRYFQNETKKYVPEGIAGVLPCRGKLADIIYQLQGGLRSGMGYCGAASLTALYERACFVKMTGSGLRESHPHDIEITSDEPNYSK